MSSAGDSTVLSLSSLYCFLCYPISKEDSQRRILTCSTTKILRQAATMDTSNSRPTPPTSGQPSMDAGDWRSQLPPESRHRIVNKIMETLKGRIPFSGDEGLNELKMIADRFEEKVFTAASSQQDYLRKISLKMLTLEGERCE